MSNVTFRIEKDTRFNTSTLTTDVNYYVWAGRECIGLFHSEEEALKMYEAAKKNYLPAASEIIKEETIDVPAAAL
jgi:hypothetical protein